MKSSIDLWHHTKIHALAGFLGRVITGFRGRLFRQGRIRLTLAVIPFLVFGTLWITPWSLYKPTLIYMTINTRALTMELSDTLYWTDGCVLDSSVIIVKQLSGLNLRFPPFNRSATSKIQNLEFSIQNGAANLDRLVFAKGETIDILVGQDNALSLYARGPLAKGTLNIQRTDLFQVEWGADVGRWSGPLILDLPEQIMFQVENSAVIPLFTSFTPRHGLQMSNISVRRIGFAQPIVGPQNQLTFESGIESGSISLPQIARNETLFSGEPLTLIDAKGVITSLKVDSDIQLFFKGSARHIRIGPENYDRELTPTFIEYLFFNSRLILLFNAIVLITCVLQFIREIKQ